MGDPTVSGIQHDANASSTLRAALNRALDDLRFNEWKNDPGNHKRFAAVQRVEQALSNQPSNQGEADAPPA